MGKNKALIIGINQYEDPGFERLKYAESDAKAIYDVLINPDIGEFAKEDVILLTGKTKPEVEESLETILNQAKKDDLVFIYFAGHGKLDKLGNLCLVTRNTKTDTLLATSVRLDDIRGIIDQSDCRRIVFVIDSCFSGAVGQSFRSGDVPAESFEQISGQGKVIISASQAYERARERDDIGHGIFTYNLVKGLEEGEADRDEDGYISIEDLYRYVCDKVKTETKGQQVPMKWGIDEKGEIVIAKSIKTLEKKRTEIERLSKNARELQNQGRLDEALDIWNKVRELDHKNAEAPQGIKQIEGEKKKRAELEAKIDKLFDYYKKGSIPGTIYNKAVGIIRNPPSTLSDKEETLTKLVEDLLNDSLTVENFVLSWNRIEKPESQTGIGLNREEEPKAQSERIIQQKEERPPFYQEKAEITPKRQIPLADKTGKWLKIAGVIAMIIVVIIIYKEVTRKEIKVAVLPPEILKFDAKPSTIKKGGSSTLEWITSNAKEVEISGIGKVELSGSMTVSPTKAATYTLIAKNEEGETVKKEVTIQVNIPLSPPEILNFVASPATIKEKGGASTLSWGISNAKEVEISGLGNVELSGSKTVSPTETTTYTITARNEEGKTVEREIMVKVNIPLLSPPEILNFVAKPSRIKKGEISTLWWKTSSAKEIFLAKQRVESSGSQNVRPEKTTSYVLTAINEEGKTTKEQVTVNVIVPKPLIIESAAPKPEPSVAYSPTFIPKKEESETKSLMIQHPERYIKIIEKSFYVAWNGTAIIHHVTIENTSDIAYKNVKVRVSYYSESGAEVGGQTGILPITTAPHSKKTYLDGGVVLGMGSSGMHVGDIEVLGAVPLTGE
jgi:uncharacterized caspase-like protein